MWFYVLQLNMETLYALVTVCVCVGFWVWVSLRAAMLKPPHGPIMSPSPAS